MAVNHDDVDYVACAEQLCNSIHDWHPQAKVALVTDKVFDSTVFDYVLPLPFGNHGGYANDWQAWYVSPFRETIKLEADMIATSPIDHWWSLFRNRDVVVSCGANDFYGNVIVSDHYRKIWTANDLPDLYNAITYWRISNLAKQWWETVASIFRDWPCWRQTIAYAQEQASTDLVYAMCAKIMGVDQVSLPMGLGPRIVHMKKHAIPIRSARWTEELVWEYVDHDLRINTVSQHGFLHYHIKTWRAHG